MAEKDFPLSFMGSIGEDVTNHFQNTPFHFKKFNGFRELLMLLSAEIQFGPFSLCFPITG